MTLERDKKQAQEKRFWRLADEARKEVDSWPAWKQAAAAGYHRGSPKSDASNKK